MTLPSGILSMIPHRRAVWTEGNGVAEISPTW
jgi:hypothetical protein